jgi:catechol 2,3-dioxygenase-like lactoylglutathione lyase family enzyme
MTLRIECLTVDCDDLQKVADFWEAALGYRRVYFDEGEVALGATDGSTSTDLLLLRVPDRKHVKNRLHLDLRPDDRDAEVARLESLGATRADIGQAGGESWVVMADPEGNEFCVLKALAPGEQPYEGDVGFQGAVVG